MKIGRHKTENMCEWVGDSCDSEVEGVNADEFEYLGAIFQSNRQCTREA